jgi:hypothetical protein
MPVWCGARTSSEQCINEALKDAFGHVMPLGPVDGNPGQVVNQISDARLPGGWRSTAAFLRFAHKEGQSH